MKLSNANYIVSTRSALPEENRVYPQYFIAICAFYSILASLLAMNAHYGVLDEDFHLIASKAFADAGVNRATLYQHVPPTGVASHIWFALWMKLFPGIDFVGLRLITCAALFVVAGFVYWHIKSLPAGIQKKVMAVGWFALVCPYLFLCISTIETEGPSLIFLFAGLLLLSISRFQRVLPFFLGCLLLGITTIARFYYIPLLPAVFVVLVLTNWSQYVHYGFKDVLVKRGLLYIAIGISLLPLVGLILLWGGLTPPAFHQWSKLRSGVSFNALRPFTALALTGIYSVPIVLVNAPWRSKTLLRTVLIGLSVALVLTVFNVNFFHDTSSVDDVFSGPVEHGLAWVEARGEWAFKLALFVVYGLSFLSLSLVAERLISYIRAGDFTDKGFVFSVVFVLAFIVSQAFVGGNHPFFERYLIQPWPFIGYMLVQLFPGFLNVRTYLVLTAYTVLSVLILVKW